MDKDSLISALKNNFFGGEKIDKGDTVAKVTKRDNATYEYAGVYILYESDCVSLNNGEVKDIGHTSATVKKRLGTSGHQSNKGKGKRMQWLINMPQGADKYFNDLQVCAIIFKIPKTQTIKDLEEMLFSIMSPNKLYKGRR